MLKIPSRSRLVLTRLTPPKAPSPIPRTLPSLDKSEGRLRFKSTGRDENNHQIKKIDRNPPQRLRLNSTLNPKIPLKTSNNIQKCRTELKKFGLMIQPMKDACQQILCRWEGTQDQQTQQEALLEALLDYSKKIVSDRPILKHNCTLQKTIQIKQLPFPRPAPLLNLHKVCEFSLSPKDEHIQGGKYQAEDLLKVQQSYIQLQRQYEELQRETENKSLDRQVLVENEFKLNRIIEEQRRNHQTKKIQLEEISGQLNLYRQKKEEFDKFLNTQPNQILKEEAIGYKKCEQALFDAAQLLENSLPQNTYHYAHEQITPCRMSFESIVKDFPKGFVAFEEKGVFQVKGDEVVSFRESVLEGCKKCVDKVIDILDKKCLKLKEIVEVMRKLASYTIGKREFVGQINKKAVAVYSVAVNKLGNPVSEMNSLSEDKIQNSADLGPLHQARALIDQLYLLYEQTSVFY